MDLDDEEFESTRKLHARLRKPSISKALDTIKNYKDYSTINSDLIEALDTIIEYFEDLNKDISNQ